jgi:hypothetical protein
MNNIPYSLLHPNMYGQKLLQMFLDDNALKLKPKVMRLIGIVKVYNANMNNHLQDHQLCLELKNPIWEAMVLV